MVEPYLSEEQQIALFHAVGQRIASIVTNTRVDRVGVQVSDIASIPLLGAFVSLKRDGELRSCMGMMSDLIPLGEAVDQAAVHAAKDDPRFSPITASELFDLEMEIWLLWGMRRVVQRGESRLDAIIIGEHGVQISRGGNRGLLLPGVAVEYGMDARQFLEAVCRKAGLPTDAWLDDGALLHTFEGRAIRGPFAAINIGNKKIADELIFAAKFQRGDANSNTPTLADAEEIRNVCVDTFRAMTENLIPPAYFPGLFDGNVSGIMMEFRIPDRPSVTCTNISIRPDIRLQSSVIEMLQVLGNQVVRLGVTFYDIRDFTIDLAIFWDPSIHGNASRFDLSLVDTSCRSVMITSRDGWVLLYDSNHSAEELVGIGLGILEPVDLDLCDVISFETVSTTPQITLSSVQKTREWRESRPSAVAGTFYPSDVDGVNRELDVLFRGVDSGEGSVRRRCSAVLVPHAGWRYSGQLVARTLSAVEIPERVIIFAPKHRAGGVDWCIAPNLYWELPGQRVESDIGLAKSILKYVDLIDFDDVPHLQEHSIEVQLPILRRLSPKSKVVGIVMALSSWGMIQAGAAQFAKFLESLGDKQPLLVVSSDMNHFASDTMTRKVDRMALDALRESVVKGKPEILFDTVMRNQISMCGIVPMTFVLESLRCMNRLHDVVEIGYATSAESSGDKTRVVGYAGCVIE
ncbi:MAG: AmmeMemoRadiSam system protein B [Planctomycetaceae bacterium]|jgi:AmmeMemoRadiSam system protein B/AmmeMemoRadiSam system protein A|nr:AmmeMemoRadiSam system protein B [Planctomycetaceae bacterium]